MRGAGYGRLRAVQALVKAGGDLFQKNNNGDTALHNAALYGHFKVVEYYLASGGDVNAINEVC
mgnify:CR=1 FL=1